MNELKIKPLEIEYIQGKCFLCTFPCEEKGYLHRECAICYCDDKEKKLYDNMLIKESIQDKRMEKMK